MTEEQINKIIDIMISKENYQEVFEKSNPGKKAIYHGKATKNFKDFARERAKKFVESRLKKKSKLKVKTEKLEDEIGDKKDKIEQTQIDIDIIDNELESSATRIKVPAVFKRSYEEVWTPIIQKEIEMYKKGKVRIKGFLILLEGFAKSGKSHFAQSAVDFKGYKSKYRNIPSGRPVYVVEADDANRDELETKWYKYLPSDKHPEGLIHINNCHVENKETGFIDPEATLENMYAGIFSLKHRTQGTMVMDPFGLFCDLILFVYMLKHTDKHGAFDITFDEFIKPSRKITIFEYQYKKKLIYEVLRMFRNYKINIILISNLKDVFSEGDSMYDQRKTGKFKADVQKGTEYWVDIIGRFFKKETEHNIKKKDGTMKRKTITTRHLAIMDCRFEDEQIDSDKYVFKAPTFTDVVNKLMEVYPKE